MSIEELIEDHSPQFVNTGLNELTEIWTKWLFYILD